jgi:hypothetical protein
MWTERGHEYSVCLHQKQYRISCCQFSVDNRMPGLPMIHEFFMSQLITDQHPNHWMLKVNKTLLHYELRNLSLEAAMYRGSFNYFLHNLITVWRIPSSWMWCRVTLVRTDVSEERIASIIRVKRISELGMLAPTRQFLLTLLLAR